MHHSLANTGDAQDALRPPGFAELPWAPAGTLERLRQMAERPVVVAVAAGSSNTVSGKDLRALTLGAATMLRGAGVGRGTVVAIWAPNGAAWIAAGLACHYLGASSRR